MSHFQSQDKLLQLINYKLEGIIQQEYNNRNMIHLYDAGNGWIAFNKSAYFLSQVTKHHNLIDLELTVPPYSVITVDIPNHELSTLYSLFMVSEDNLEYKSFSTALSLAFYNDWYQENI